MREPFSSSHNKNPEWGQNTIESLLSFIFFKYWSLILWIPSFKSTVETIWQWFDEFLQKHWAQADIIHKYAPRRYQWEMRWCGLMLWTKWRVKALKMLWFYLLGVFNPLLKWFIVLHEVKCNEVWMWKIQG